MGIHQAFLDRCRDTLCLEANMLLNNILVMYKYNLISEKNADVCVSYILRDHTDLLRSYDALMQDYECRTRTFVDAMTIEGDDLLSDILETSVNK